MNNLVKSYIESFDPPASAGLYRIVDRGSGYEPQMSYSMGIAEGLVWFPLNEDGYWLEPDAFGDGKVTKSAQMPRTSAERAIQRAMAIEGVHLKAVK